ncbi:hypothetical protein EDD18DRAFT_338974 [Armillaria luteobubalina]|uniref:Peptidase C14 caspase domain-containing protein n=1 Tax=Armillaria luteobubalina TaxID=153913 RepID=A0AA39QM54_9AGAR|nr:hypothetical protein EDD18DRAFT_338974 [Armillaria luteobubalina]
MTRENDVIVVELLSILRYIYRVLGPSFFVQYYYSTSSTTIIIIPQSSRMSPPRRWTFFAFGLCNTTVHRLVSSARVNRGACQDEEDHRPISEPLEKPAQEDHKSHLAEKLGFAADSVDAFHHILRRKDFQSDKRLTQLCRHCLKLRSFWDCLEVHNIQHPFPPEPSYHVDTSSFWAVVIGIDGYECAPLRGCVSDARLSERYLNDALCVPRERIQLLLGYRNHNDPDDPMYPSRAHITTTLLSLIDNPNIEKGDNIIIYYAGHGSSYQCSDYTNVEDTDYQIINPGSTKYIEALCPIDRDTVDENGNIIPDISDREFNTILTLISRSKGNHITVILDCCHSASVSREVPPQGARAFRATERATLRDMLYAGDRLLRDRPGYRSISEEDWSADEESHVVLAACEAYQFAKERWIDEEDGSRVCVGVFTYSLLCLLRSGQCSAETTYADLCSGLDGSHLQTPVIAGKYRHARLWYQKPSRILVRRSKISSYQFWIYLTIAYSLLVYLLYNSSLYTWI